MSVALVLTGAPGTGKSSVLEALTTLLEIDGVEYSALEAEQLAWGCPWLAPSEWVPQLAAVMALQREVGRRLSLVAATTETTGQLRSVVSAVGADRTVVVLLVASPDVVAGRLGSREPDRWPGKTDLIAHARELAVSMPRDLEEIDARIETAGREPIDVAGDVHEVLSRSVDGESRSDPTT